MSVAADAPAVDVLSELDFDVSLPCDVLKRGTDFLLVKAENRARLLSRGWATCAESATWSLRWKSCPCGNVAEMNLLCDRCMGAFMERGIQCTKCKRPLTAVCEPL